MKQQTSVTQDEDKEKTENGSLVKIHFEGLGRSLGKLRDRPCSPNSRIGNSTRLTWTWVTKIHFFSLTWQLTLSCIRMTLPTKHLSTCPDSCLPMSGCSAYCFCRMDILVGPSFRLGDQQGVPAIRQERLMFPCWDGKEGEQKWAFGNFW